MNRTSNLDQARLLSGAEFIFGAAIVIGHNLLGVLPNEVVILCLLAFISSKLRSGNWSAIGFRRPDSWRNVLLLALVAAALRIVFGEFIESIGNQIGTTVVAPTGSDQITGNIRLAILALAVVWTFAAFGEEIAYRGYLLTRVSEFLGESSLAWWAGVLIVSVLFGLGHFYKGPIGVIDSGVAGFILGAAYMLARRNLWVCVLAHGFINTVAVALLYFGLDS